MMTSATVLSYTVRPDKADALHAALRDHLVPAARKESGYRGFLVLDQGEGKRVGIVIFDSPENAKAAQQGISGAARDAGIYEMMAGPPSGSMGTAIVTDGIFSA